VLEADRDLAVVQVLEGTSGMRSAGTSVEFSGSPLPAEPVLTGVSVIDELMTLVRGQKLPPLF
jgi:vacuolar-type H+-ATPase subunit B/Vma2